MATGRALTGFPERLPEQEIAQQHLIRLVREQFELHGFTPLLTRSVERLDDLLSKGETDKEIYGVERIGGRAESGRAKLGLHYDLTVPFARYVVERQGQLVFPFRRYQIQPAWRGERPQLGRYREFVQADADVIGQGKLDLRHDADLLALLRDTLKRLPIPKVQLLVNNRKLLEGFYRGLGVTDIAETLRVVDKLPKIGSDKVGELLTELGLNDEQTRLCLALCDFECASREELEGVRELGVRDELMEAGIEELGVVLERCHDPEWPEGTVAALHIARGFDYYTGTVVEGKFAEHPELGSVCSGGRYDNLAASAGGKTRFPGVGVSLGITRIMGYCEHLGKLTQSRKTPAQVLVILHAEDQRARSESVAAQLRARGIPCLVSDSAAAYGKQIRVADRLGIPYVWFPGATERDHEVKNVVSGDQSPADPGEWTPDPELVATEF